MTKESTFQKQLVSRLKDMFPDCIVLKNDSSYLQGFPDLTVFYKDKWVTLETKRSKNAAHQSNQDYYVDKLNQMSYSSFVYPENVEEVLREVQRTLGTS